jgi:hypothetical protein
VYLQPIRACICGAGVGDGGAVAEMLRSIMAPPSGGAEAVTWLIPASPFADKGATPFCSAIEPIEIIGSHCCCEVCMVWRRRFHRHVQWFCCRWLCRCQCYCQCPLCHCRCPQSPLDSAIETTTMAWESPDQWVVLSVLEAKVLMTCSM